MTSEKTSSAIRSSMRSTPTSSVWRRRSPICAHGERADRGGRAPPGGLRLHVRGRDGRVRDRGGLRQVRGMVGMTSRLAVELNTPANDAYQAASAVSSPSQPPTLLMPLEALYAPMHRKRKVSVSSRKTAMIAPEVRMDARNM